MDNTAAEILVQLKKNEVQLAGIAANQEQLLAVEQKRLTTERLQLFTNWAKIAALILIAWLSIVAAQKMITGLTSSMGGLMGGNSLEINGAQDLTNQLKGSEELLRELLGN